MERRGREASTGRLLKRPLGHERAARGMPCAAPAQREQAAGQKSGLSPFEGRPVGGLVIKSWDLLKSFKSFAADMCHALVGGI